ncbi:hypothetical protein PHAVU_009G256600 [Phaseolus vulgaris]|uniref:Uncharacterized protein n=1 Tax=Phaseolus vulgaris TaxID=3885 RepID=V7AZB7_PHAVU|nr:hypothetical protein PHAVU_009G256600g [Phaseolus vulgaris]ESW10997.1 hypothetical protein PHAVU_009G256600g [Phaseolus vulgaris]
MGTGHSSHTNLGSECSSYDAGETGTIARLGDSFEVSMGHNKEKDNTDVWSVKYKTSQKKNTCGFNLKASRDNNGVESIHFGLGDFANNKTEFALKITRVGRDGLQGGISGIDSCNAPMSFTRAKPDHTIETTIVPYGCSFREGLFVLEMKKKVNGEHAYMVNMAHYYVTKDVGLSVEAKIQRSKNCFRVEVEGPFNHPSDELRKVLVKTRRTGIWSRSACSHCNVAKAKSGESNSSLKAKASPQKSHEVVGQIAHHAFSSTIKEQYNKGLINSTGYTSGSLNHSIIFIDCNF